MSEEHNDVIYSIRKIDAGFMKNNKTSETILSILPLLSVGSLN